MQIKLQMRGEHVSQEAEKMIDARIDARLRKIMEERNLYEGAAHSPQQKSEERAVMPELASGGLPARKPRQQTLHPLNQILYGAPGTGKTYSAVEYALAILENRAVSEAPLTNHERTVQMETWESYRASGQIVFTTFHQSYGYEEFIQGIRPGTSGETVSFQVADGIFKKMADAARKDMENSYVIVIDEINRGNISRIFGELITLLEEDKRWGEQNQLAVTLPLGELFAIPNNLYVIGTMNSADKSISLIDAALRRRFDFVELAPRPELIGDTVLRDVMVRLNRYLRRELRSTDLLVGHSFFIGKQEKDLGNIMNRNIIPLLYEYFYDEEAKVKKALECISDSNFETDDTGNRRIRVKEKGSQ